MSISIHELKRRRTARIVARLFQELEAGRFDSDVVRKLTAIPGPHLKLLRAVALAQAGYLASARQQVDACASDTARNSGLKLASALVLYATRDYQRALDLARSTATDPDYAGTAFRLWYAFAGNLGWEVEVGEAIDAAIAHGKEELLWATQAAGMHLRGRNYAGALPYLERAIAAVERGETEDGEDFSLFRLLLQQAKVLVELTDYAGAKSVLSQARTLPEAETPDGAWDLAKVYLSLADLDTTRELILYVHKCQPQAELLAELGRMALWVNDFEQALRWAEQALDLDAQCAAALRIVGAVAVCQGNFAAAAEPLAAAVELDPREYEAHVWRAEAALRLGDYNTVHAQLHQASMKSNGLLFISWMLRFIAAARQNNTPNEPVGPHRTEEFITAVLELCPGNEGVFERQNEGEIEALIERALVQMGGNRTVMATAFDAKTATVRRLKTRSGARYSSRHALQLIRVMPAKQALAALDRVVADYPRSSLPICHRGELELWMGNLEQARADLNRAIEILPYTRWAYIGLTGIDILNGDYERALDTSTHGVRTMGNTEGPSVYIYRGEALRRLGRYGEALQDLIRSVRIHPSRVSAWLNLGLVYVGQGEFELFERVFARLSVQASGLLSDAAYELGETLWGDPGFTASVEVRTRVLEHALAMMGGNRSSTAMTYFTRSGAMRMVEHRDATTPEKRSRFNVETNRFRRARTLILRELGLAQADNIGDAGPVAAEPKDDPMAWQPPDAPVLPKRGNSLTPEQIREFETRGFIQLKQCFSREAAKIWVDDACRRLRDEPETWIPKAQRNPQEPRFDRHDRSTWVRKRLSLPGPRLLPISEFAPRAWEAICDLLGGPQRVKTTEWSDYFVINFRCDPERLVDPHEELQLSGDAWHIDDPKLATRLDNWHHGLIVMCLFSDVKPRGGGTLFACDSPAKVARYLAQHPEGTDFVNDGRVHVQKLLAQCHDYHEVTGEVGDVLLIHPLMLHAGSDNRSRDIRWMSNPLIFTEQPMDFWRDDRARESVVERVIRQAIEAPEAIV